MTEAKETAARIALLRRKARRFGLVIGKSRARHASLDDHLGWRVWQLSGNFVVAGARYDLTLDDVEEHLRHEEAEFLGTEESQ
jgi:hypothetical protein